MLDSKKFAPAVAVILAGGTGSRFGGDSPKQLKSLAGQPILAHTLRKFASTDLSLDRVVVVGNADWEPEIKAICEQSLRWRQYALVSGGDHRNGSVRAAVDALGDLEEARVLIHDGVRPLVSQGLINRVLESLDSPGCVLPVIPSVDPIVEVINGEVIGFQDRSSFYRGQSPQGFWLSDLRAALDLANASLEVEAPFSTVFEMVRFYDPTIQIRTVAGDLNNLKITMPVDHLMAGRLILEE